MKESSHLSPLFMSVDMLSLIDKMFKPKEKGGKDRFFSFNSRKQKTYKNKNKKPNNNTIIYIWY